MCLVEEKARRCACKHQCSNVKSADITSAGVINGKVPPSTAIAQEDYRKELQSVHVQNRPRLILPEEVQNNIDFPTLPRMPKEPR